MRGEGEDKTDQNDIFKYLDVMFADDAKSCLDWTNTMRYK